MNERMEVKSRRAPVVALSGMMFLEYAIRGVWTAYLPNYLIAQRGDGGLGFTGGQSGSILLPAVAIGAIFAPIVGGQIADRYFNAERAMAILLLVSGIVVYATASVFTFGAFLALTCIASIAFMPTMALTNSIAMAHLPDARRQFPPIRAVGTFGWIVASSLFTIFWLNQSNHAINTARIADALRVAGVMCAIFAIYCLIFLPRTAPRPDRAHPLAFVHAMALLRQPGFLVFALVALLASVIHQTAAIRLSPFLEADVGVSLKWIGPALAVGQWGELIFLTILGAAIKRVGYRGVFLIAMIAYVARFVLLATLRTPGIVISFQALHGLSFAFIFAAGALYVEAKAPADARHSAQALLGLILWGVAPLMAIPYNKLFDRFTIARDGQMVQDYRAFWLAQAGIALLAAILLLLGFNGRHQARPT